MILALQHAQITIPSGREDEARGFYCGKLGLVEIPKPDNLKGRGGFWLQLPGLQLHVGTEDGVDRRLTKAHLGFEVDNLEQLRRVVAEAGLEISGGPPVPGFDRFEFRDPFGNRMEFLQRKG
jgi:catechol 2,3-dioxygenase-like lactoylglutathione lyase family enzyme